LIDAGHLRVGMIGSGGKTLAPGLREIALLQFGVDASAGNAAFRRSEDDRPKPALQTPGYIVPLDIEPVDSRAGGYVWTAVDGSVAFAAPEAWHQAANADDGNAVSDAVLRGGRPGGGVEVAFDADDSLDLESALGEIADDIAAAWWTSSRA
jgi:hypothetical protein